MVAPYPPCVASPLLCVSDPTGRALLSIPRPFHSLSLRLRLPPHAEINFFGCERYNAGLYATEDFWDVMAAVRL